jgi:prepilin-type N-terminal cleavage/methylation domain-containing protein
MPTILKKRIFNQRGITLIELIAVILIIGIIAAVGIPVVFNQISSAKDETDKANQAVFAGAVERYALINDGYPKSVGTTPAVLTTEFINAMNGEKGGPYLRADFPLKKANGGAVWGLYQDALGAAAVTTAGQDVKSIK